jgi:hypothetical protein
VPGRDVPAQVHKPRQASHGPGRPAIRNA